MLTMELTNRDSYISMPSMCVHGLGRQLFDDKCLVAHCIWLGWSLGAIAASEAAKSCEIALSQPRATVMLDNRVPYPM